MKNIMRVLILAVLFSLSQNLSAQEVSASEAQESLTNAMQETCVQTIFRSRVEYPVLARLARIEGKSLCKVQLDENGRPLKAELVEARNPILDQEALRILSSETEFKTDCKQREVIVSVVFKLH